MHAKSCGKADDDCVYSEPTDDYSSVTAPQTCAACNVLGVEPLHVDEIRNQTELPIEKVSATLALMELKGMVRQVGGMNYVAVHEVQSDYST